MFKHELLHYRHKDFFNKTHLMAPTEAVAALVLDSYTWSKINLGVDKTLVVSTYDKLDAKTTTVISKWTNYPTMTNNVAYIGNVTHGTY